MEFELQGKGKFLSSEVPDQSIGSDGCNYLITSIGKTIAESQTLGLSKLRHVWPGGICQWALPHMILDLITTAQCFTKKGYS